MQGLTALLEGPANGTSGNILMGGAGSDTLTGRAGDDYIDGDAFLKAELVT